MADILAALYWKKAAKPGIIAAMVSGSVVCVSLATCKKQPSVYLESPHEK